MVACLGLLQTSKTRELGRTEWLLKSFLRLSDYMNIALAFCALCCQLLCHVHTHSQLLPVHLGVVICNEN